MNRFYIYTFLSFIVTSIIGQDLPFNWAIANGSNALDEGRAIATDKDGNTFITGTFNGTVDFDPGSSSETITSSGGSDGFVQKLDQDGNLMWIKSFGGSSNDAGNAIATDANGNSYITGTFVGTAQFSITGNNTTLTSNGTTDIFILKLNADGDFQWVKQVGGVSTDAGSDIKIDQSNNILVTGQFFGNNVDFNPGAGTSILNSNGFADIFILKLSEKGDFLWAKNIGASNANDYGRAITIDAMGNSYTTGRFSGTVDFDPGASTTELTSNGSDDIFILKINSEGQFDWAINIGAEAPDGGEAITLDQENNVYATGYFDGSADFDPGAGTTILNSTSSSRDIFILKMTSEGRFLWAKQIGGTTNDDRGLSVVVDMLGNSYISGHFESTVDFDPGTAVNNITSKGNMDAFIEKLDKDGNFVWVKTFGSFLDDKGNSITTDQFGNILLTGEFQGTIDFDPSIGGTNNLTSKGNKDIFALKLGDVALGNHSTDLKSTFSIYPTQVKDVLTIDMTEVHSTITASILNAKGQRLSSKTYRNQSNFQMTINYPRGIYYLQLITPQGHTSIKLLKE